MHILLAASAFNSLTQRVYAELGDRGHTVAVELAADGGSLRDAVRRTAPELVVAPMPKPVIPADVSSAYTCLVIHPGPVGDLGRSPLDWVVQDGASRWEVTVLQAGEELDGRAVRASATCAVPPVGRSDLYRNEIADAAVEALLTAVERFASGAWSVPGVSGASAVPGATAVVRPYLDQSLRRIDWQADPTATVLRKLRAADSSPGVLDELLGSEWYLHGGHPEHRLRGRPGALLATRAGAVCRATADGAVWIPELRQRRRAGEQPTYRLPAVLALGRRLPRLPEDPVPLHVDGDGGVDGGGGDGGGRRAWTDISYREEGAAGFLSFSFPGGAMSTDHCVRLLAAYRYACSRPTSVLVLGGGRDIFANGIHLNVIDAAADPAFESWANTTAIDDLAEAVLTTTDRLVVSAVGGNAAAGGAMLALAADEVWCRAGAVLNPHYRLMGLYGSEYWTYSLPRRVGAAAAARLTRQALPVSAVAGRRLGLVDRVVGCAPQEFRGAVAAAASALASAPGTQARIAAKKAERDRQEQIRPLAAHREEELARMRRIFFDPGAPYHALRRAFVRGQGQGGTPAYLRAAAERVAVESRSGTVVHPRTGLGGTRVPDPPVSGRPPRIR